MKGKNPRCFIELADDVFALITNTRDVARYVNGRTVVG
jgi:hypothetical protein